MKTTNCKHHIIRIVLLLLIGCSMGWILVSVPLRAQSISPINSQTFYHPPYIHKLDDLIRANDNKLELNLRMLDVSVTQAKIKIRLVLESDRIRIENPIPLANTYDIGGGETLSLNLSELRKYFDLSALSFSGISRSDFLKNGGRLPDGLYRLHFEAFEASSGTKVSLHEIPAIFSIVSCDPPLINTPAQNSTVLYQNYIHINFSWSPRHMSAGAFESEYEFELRELPENYKGDWQHSFEQLSIIYRQRLTETTLLYDETFPPLTVGKRYVFRIKAYAFLADGSSLLFNNNGYSEIYSFLYKENCQPFSAWHVDSITAYNAKIMWNGQVNDKAYTIFVRKSEIAGAEWFKYHLEKDVSEYIIYPLEPSTSYECMMSHKCEFAESENNPIRIFKTPSENNSSLKCGEHESVKNDNINKEPLPYLLMFDQIKAFNGFVFVIDEVSGENGYFSGKAHTYIPLLANTGVKVSFSRIFVNKNYEIVSGEIKADVSRRKL